MNRPEAPTTDFGHLAKRITRWTSNVLATVIVLAVCLALGQRVLDWTLHPSANPAVQPTENPAGVLNSLQVLQFGGDRYALRREILTGDKLSALAWIRAACRDVLKQPPEPMAELTDAERQFLDRTATAFPSERLPGRWQLYVFEDAFPLAVGVRRESAEVLNSEMVAQGRRRMAVWAMAVPMGRNRWSMYVYHNGPAARDSSGGEPLPSNARRTLALRGEDGVDMTGFTGTGDEQRWRRYFDEAYAQRGFRRVRSWRLAAGGWHARFRAGDKSNRVVDVQFGQTPQGQWVGLLTATSKSPAPKPASAPAVSKPVDSPK